MAAALPHYPGKAKRNFAKRRISFETAKQVFSILG